MYLQHFKIIFISKNNNATLGILLTHGEVCGKSVKIGMYLKMSFHSFFVKSRPVWDLINDFDLLRGVISDYITFRLHHTCKKISDEKPEYLIAHIRLLVV